MSSPNIPPVVGHRNHFDSIEELIDEQMVRCPPGLDADHVRKFLREFAERMVFLISFAMKTGAERGIEQAAKLVCDPDYYLTLKERRRKERASRAAYQQQEDQERLERKLCPTAAQVEHMRKDYINYITEAEKDIVRWKIALANLPKNPKHIVMPKGVQ